MYTAGALSVMLLMAVAFWGYGRTVQLLCAPVAPIDVGTTACVGLATYLAACGFIELTACASPALFIGIIAIGVLLAAIHVSMRGFPYLPALRRGNSDAGHGWGLILLLLLALYLAFLINAAWWHFVNNDDTQGYLVLLLRTLQTGSTGTDPFMFRRVEAGLGGNTYLYVLPTALLDFPAAHIADFGLGSLLLGLLVSHHAGEFCSAQ